MERLKIKKGKCILIAVVAAVILILAGIFLLMNFADKTSYMDVNKLCMSDSDTFLAYSDYVFVGTVVKADEACDLITDPGTIVYTPYTVQLESNLKGSLRDEVLLYKAGGTDSKTNRKTALRCNGKKDHLPETDQKYIFIASCDIAGNIVASFDGSLPYSEENLTLVQNALKSNTNLQRERYKSSFEKTTI